MIASRTVSTVHASRASGCLLATASGFSAASEGRRALVSQAWTVLGLTLRMRENAAWDTRRLTRTASTSLASVHEFGSRPIAVKLTPKARAFLHAAFRRAGLDSPSTGIAIIKVPARPFLCPVLEKYGADAEVVAVPRTRGEESWCGIWRMERARDYSIGSPSPATPPRRFFTLSAFHLRPG